MRTATMPPKKGESKRSEKTPMVQVRLYRPMADKIAVIAAYLKSKEGREVTVAETMQIIAGDEVNAFYVKALREMQKDLDQP